MRRSHFASLVAFVLSGVFRLINAILRLDFADHRTRIVLDQVARDAKTPSAIQRFKAFVSRAFAHDRYSGGRFDLARSTPA